MKKVCLLLISFLGLLLTAARSQSGSCPVPVDLTVNVEPLGTSAFVSWFNSGISTSTYYEYAVNTNAQPPVQGDDTTELTGVMVYNLVVNTQYYLHVRTHCDPDVSGWSTHSFIPAQAPPPSNDECMNAVSLMVFSDSCHNATEGTTLSATSSSTMPLPVCGNDSAGYDDDVWFKFTPSTGQTFVTIDFTFINGDIGLVAQIYTSSNNTSTGVFSLFACSDDEGQSALPGFNSLPVVPGTTYFMRVFTYSRNTWGQFAVCVKKTLIANDNAYGAFSVTVDQPCSGAIYTNIASTQSPDEPSGSCSSITGYSTVWYKFIAPLGGAVKISTATGTGNTLVNSRIALFEATDVTNYSTFNIISCDEDGGAGSMDKMSVLYATGLTPDRTYYIQVDRYNTSIAQGTFCLTVETLRSSMLSTINTCNSSYQIPGSPVSSYKGWVSLMDSESKLVALVRNTQGGAGSAYSFAQTVYPGAIRKDATSGEYYLNRTYVIANSVPGTVFDIQFFFLNSELSGLAAMDRAASLNNLRVTRQSAVNCRPEFTANGGVNSELTVNGSGMVNGVNWVTVNTSAPANFYIHAVKSYLTSKVFLQGAYNPTLGRHKDVTPAWATILNTYAKNQPYNTTPYEGYGGATRGGKGQPVVHVTNLNPTGPGSLHAAMGSYRTIVFDVAGTIDNFHWEGYDVSFLTIDGSTAPSPGITLNVNGNGDGFAFMYGCHEIIVKNLRIRNAGSDGINVVGCYNMVFDHISSANNGDGDIDITQGSHNITVQHSIFGHSGSGAMLIAFPGTQYVSVHHNLFNSSGPGPGERNPFVHNANNYDPVTTNYLMCDFKNNIVWKWGHANGTGFGYGSGADYGGTLQAINNFYQSPQGGQHAIIRDHDTTGSKVYAAGNVSGNPGIDPNSVSNMPAPWPVIPVATDPACVAAAKVIAQAGSRPLDSLDQVLMGAVSIANCPGAPNQLPSGAESIAGMFLSTPSTTDIVDWVLLEIKNSSNVVVARRSAFVREDGQVVDVDGVSPVSLHGLASGSYNVSVRHRNHLGIRTASPLNFTANALGVVPTQLSYDFTTAQNKAYQNPAITTNPAMAESNSVFMLWGGDANLDGYVRIVSQAFPFINSDITYIFTSILNANLNGGLAGYNVGDVNLDGHVRITPQAFPFITSESSFLLGATFASNLLQTVQEHR